MSLQQDYDYAFKIAITGSSSVGKSSLMMRFTDDVFNVVLIPTIGVDFKIRSFTVDNKIVKLNIWDTAGQERFDAIIKAYYKGIHACLIVFDLTDRQTFQDVYKWFDKCKQNAKNEVKLILVGNKADLEEQRAVTYEEACNLAQELDMQYIETSAKSKQNVDQCFIQLSQDLIQQYIKQNKQIQFETQKQKSHLKPGGATIQKQQQKSAQCC
ncbi:small guanosine triphosphatase family Ras family protein (macronuclear) [Tetrahymena thermophila SB210]|uniref:Small guanosine triphosphatase family Ras family protein n=2 Tax=Tetrahymena thermophila TaxID=5911 RepID=I7M066_TETTS|nr:small guanosine triphosphatase family Ras family protein [Tetrahymena thermophila SB210]EAR85571.3 small guanosine triphosphatase family Ras family protein [Tetrahymena thermophila SB210]BAJ21274.1 Rab-family small GTPase Rab1F [Tetrahymena thermophila]|eukprot:XP_001033234.3 small guanosine triphosphatase family Ras family protein [Tetrahymena thermophila SB210]